MADAQTQWPWQANTFKTASATSADANIAVVAAVPGKKIKVVGVVITMVSTTETLLRFEDGSGGTELLRVDLQALSGAISGVVLPIACPGHWFSTSINAVLNLENTATETIHYTVTYYEDDN